MNQEYFILNRYTDLILAENPKNVKAWLLKAQVALNETQTAAAERFIRNALALNPHLDGALYNLSLIHRINGELNEAQDAICRAIRIDPTNASYVAACAEIRALQGSLIDAARCMRVAIALNPTNMRYQELLIALLEQIPETENNAEVIDINASL